MRYVSFGSLGPMAGFLHNGNSYVKVTPHSGLNTNNGEVVLFLLFVEVLI